MLEAMRQDVAVGLITFVMTVLGAIVSVRPPVRAGQKVAFILAFVVLGAESPGTPLKVTAPA